MRLYDLHSQLNDVPTRPEFDGNDCQYRAPAGVQFKAPYQQKWMSSIRRKTSHKAFKITDKRTQVELLFDRSANFVVVDVDVGWAVRDELGEVLDKLASQFKSYRYTSASGSPKLVVKKEFVNQPPAEFIKKLNDLLPSKFKLDRTGANRTFMTPEALDGFMAWTELGTQLPYASDLVKTEYKGYFLTGDVKAKITKARTIYTKVKIALDFLRRFYFYRNPDAEFFFSQPKLAATLGCTQGAIAKAVGRLEKEGYITVTDGRWQYGGKDSMCKRSELATLPVIKNEKRVTAEENHRKFVAQSGNNNRRLVAFIIRNLLAGKTPEEISEYLGGVEGLELDRKWLASAIKWAQRKLKFCE